VGQERLVRLSHNTADELNPYGTNFDGTKVTRHAPSSNMLRNSGDIGHAFLRCGFLHRGLFEKPSSESPIALLLILVP
jgi:hypothetical protein